MGQIICLITLVVFAMSGCSFNRSIVSSNSVGSLREIPVGIGKGYSSAGYAFGIKTGGDDSVQAAIASVLKKTRADAMTNIVADKRTTYFLFLAWTTTSVTGTLVKYIPDEKLGFVHEEINNPDKW